MLSFWHYLPWAAIGPAAGVGLGMWQRIAAPRTHQPSKRGLGLVRLITMLTRNEERRKTGLEIIRLDCANPAGVPSYLDPPSPRPPLLPSHSPPQEL